MITEEVSDGFDDDNNDKDDGRDLDNALASLENKTELSTLTVTLNSNLIWIDYLKNCSNLSALCLKGCTSINDTSMAEIKAVVQRCGSKCTYESKYWLSLLDENTKVLDLSNQIITETQLLTLKDRKSVV